ncbi:MAG TPA: hypothetical protein VFA71_05685 [Terriglobales bacterium]|nr:hypothetical protein [Terriglobales bacterium]
MATRFMTMCFLLLLGLSTIGFGQAKDAEAAASVASGEAGYARMAPSAVDRSQPIQLTIGTSTILDATTGAVVGNEGAAQNDANISSNAASSHEGNDGDEDFDDVRHTPKGGTIDGLDTVPTFDGAFFAQAGPSSTTTRLFRFSMMGNHPLAGETTLIPAKISEVSLQLLNADGSTLTTVAFTPFEDLTLDSPNFEEANYRSGHHLQFADAVQRAEFFHRMGKDWHTILRPQVVNRITLTVPRFVNVRLANGNVVQARSYFIGTAADGHTFVLMLNVLFNFFFNNEVVNEINAGNFTTKALNMTLFPNTFLFSLNVNNPNAPGGCCVLGFHTYFFQPGAIPQPRWITQYASWISPGVFGAGFEDVTALSHETSEAFNDPFVDNVTPSWQFPGQPANSHVCQGNLETGDPVEVLPTATVPITIRERHEVFTYHPQTEALLQWFEMGATSNAVDGAFSFPGEGALSHSALPCPP